MPASSIIERVEELRHAIQGTLLVLGSAVGVDVRETLAELFELSVIAADRVEAEGKHIYHRGGQHA